MRRHRGIAFVLLALLALIAACSDDGGGDDAATDDTDTPSSSAPDSDGSTSTTAGGGAPGGELPAGYEGYVSEQYADGQNWLCHPQDADENVCDRDLDATLVSTDGTTEVEPHVPTDEPAVDCFYVYPTISADAGPVADFNDSPTEEGNAALNQASRFSSVCNVYAPVYRQITVNGLGGGATEGDREQAYADVLDAWKQYVTHDNEGRGVVLIGHSQGSGHLRRLIAEEIDGVPALQDRLVSAILLGAAIGVEDEFESVPICTEDGEVGCVISYATFRATAPPPPDTYFGVIDGPDRAACTNPASVGGGSAPLTPYFPTEQASPFSGEGPEITTPWITYPDFLTGECVQDGDVDYLSLTIASDPADPRTDDINGDLTPQWGLHLVDANIAMGDLVDLTQTQIDAYGS
jgi:hypothetical protein